MKLHDILTESMKYSEEQLEQFGNLMPVEDAEEHLYSLADDEDDVFAVSFTPSEYGEADGYVAVEVGSYNKGYAPRLSGHPDTWEPGDSGDLDFTVVGAYIRVYKGDNEMALFLDADAWKRSPFDLTQSSNSDVGDKLWDRMENREPDFNEPDDYY